MRVGIELTGITVIIYAIGWGPTLAVGLVFGVADCMRSVGAATTKPAIILSVVLIGLGQIGIAAGIVPTLVPQPLVQALAVLALVGLVFTCLLYTSQLRRRPKESAQRRHPPVERITVVPGHGAVFGPVL